MREPVEVKRAETVTGIGSEAADDKRGKVKPSRAIAPQRKDCRRMSQWKGHCCLQPAFDSGRPDGIKCRGCQYKAPQAARFEPARHSKTAWGEGLFHPALPGPCSF